MTEQTQVTQRETKPGLAKLLDIAFVPSSYIRFVAETHKHYEKSRQKANAQQGLEVPPLSMAWKAAGYISATGVEIIRLMIYSRLAECFYKTLNQ